MTSRPPASAPPVISGEVKAACGPISSMPPSTTYESPVTYPAAVLANTAITPATSRRRRGWWWECPDGRYPWGSWSSWRSCR
jgi:hypothetical protein